MVGTVTVFELLITDSIFVWPIVKEDSIIL